MTSKELGDKSKASPRRSRTNSFYGDITAAKITSSTAIHVSRSQILGTIIVSVFALLGVAVANLDKLRRNEAPEAVNKLKLENNVERAREYLLNNSQQAREVRRILTLKNNVQIVDKAVMPLDMYTAANNDRQDSFKRETERLNVGLQSNNWEAIDTSRKRMTAILLEEGSNLQDSMIQMKHLINPSDEFEDTRKSPQKSDPDGTVDRFMKRTPVLDLAQFLPIRTEPTIAPSFKKNSAIGPDLKDNAALEARRRFADLGAPVESERDERSPTAPNGKRGNGDPSTGHSIGVQNYFFFNRSMSLPSQAASSACIADGTCLTFHAKFSF